MFSSSSNKYNPKIDIPNLAGKVFVVTGGSAGIGFGISAHLLRHQCSALYLLGKKEDHLSEAIKALKDYGDTSRVRPIQIELESLSNTAQAAASLKRDLTRLDGLVLNAGLGIGVYNESEDGIDTHMQVNVIAQHILTRALLPLLIKTPDSRLVLQSSDLHRAAPDDVRFESLAELNRDIGAMKLYNRFKLGQVLIVRALYRRKERGELGLKKGEAPWVNATHPGAVRTDQQEQAIEAYGTMGKIGVKAVRPFMKDAESEGSRPALFAATGDLKSEGLDGAYIVPDRKATEVSKQGQDEELGERLWNLTERILTERLGETYNSLCS